MLNCFQIQICKNNNGQKNQGSLQRQQQTRPNEKNKLRFFPQEKPKFKQGQLVKVCLKLSTTEEWGKQYRSTFLPKTNKRTEEALNGIDESSFKYVLEVHLRSTCRNPNISLLNLTWHWQMPNWQMELWSLHLTWQGPVQWSYAPQT